MTANVREFAAITVHAWMNAYGSGFYYVPWNRFGTFDEARRDGWIRAHHTDDFLVGEFEGDRLVTLFSGNRLRSEWKPEDFVAVAQAIDATYREL